MKNTKMTVGYDNGNFYVYNNGKRVVKLTLELVPYLFNNR